MSIQEKTYYNERGVIITNARAILGSKTFSMANITSVSSAIIPANKTPGIILTGLGLIFTIGSICLTIGFLASVGLNNFGGLVVFGITIVFGLLVLAAGIIVLIRAKPQYILRIGSASGEANALVSQDLAYIRNIVNALNKAIVERG